MENSVNLIDAETIRLLITALSGFLGVIVGGVINYLITKGQANTESKLQQQKFDNENRKQEKVLLEQKTGEKKKMYASYIEEAMRYSDKKDNFEALRKITVEVVLNGSNSVAIAVSRYLNEISDSFNITANIPINHDEYVTKIINSIRKELLSADKEIDIHLVHSDKDKELLKKSTVKQ